MNDFIEEYGWTAVTGIGGALGIAIFSHFFWGPSSVVAQVVSQFIENLI